MTDIERLTCLRVAASGTNILGAMVRRQDAKAAWMTQAGYYDWYVAAGKAFTPKAVGEIGVRFGYSLWCIASAAEAQVAYGWDDESYEPGSIDVARRNLAAFNPCLMRANTKRLSRLECGAVDLFHVDGDHTYDGALHDLLLAWDATKSGGIILVDDVWLCPEVGNATSRFCRLMEVELSTVPTLRGLGLFRRK